MGVYDTLTRAGTLLLGLDHGWLIECPQSSPGTSEPREIRTKVRIDFTLVVTHHVLFSMCVRVCVCAHMPSCMNEDQRTAFGSPFSPHHVDLGDQTLVIKLSGNHLYPLSRPSSAQVTDSIISAISYWINRAAWNEMWGWESQVLPQRVSITPSSFRNKKSISYVYLIIQVLRLEYRENYHGPCAVIVKCLLFFCVAVGRKKTEPFTSVPVAAATCHHCLSITTVLCHPYSHNSGWPPVCYLTEDSLELWILCFHLPRIGTTNMYNFAQAGLKLTSSGWLQTWVPLASASQMLELQCVLPLSAAQSLSPMFCDKVSRSLLGWSQTWYMTKDDLKLWILCFYLLSVGITNSVACADLDLFV